MSVNKETVTVERIGKFGIMSGGVWYNLSSKGGAKLSDFSPMSSYEVLVYTSDGGKKYINQIVGNGTKPVGVNEVLETTARIQKAGDDKLLTILKDEAKKPIKIVGEVDWDKKNAQIRAQGTVQAAVQSPALQMFAANYDEWIALVEKVAQYQLDFIRKNS